MSHRPGGPGAHVTPSGGLGARVSPSGDFEPERQVLARPVPCTLWGERRCVQPPWGRLWQHLLTPNAPAIPSPPETHLCVPPPDRRPGVHGSTGHNSPQWGAARTPHGGAADGPCVVYSRSGATGKDTGEPLGCWKVPFCTCVLQTKLCLPTNPYIDALTPDGIFGDEPLGAHRFWGHKAVGSP